MRRASAVSLLRSDSLGERPPRSQWFLVLPGLGLLGGAYYLAVTITEPITAMLVFFVAVVMVILATFLLFIAAALPSAARSKAMTGSITRRKTSSRSPRSSIV